MQLLQKVEKTERQKILGYKVVQPKDKVYFIDIISIETAAHL